MEKLTVITWLWGDKYVERDVARLQRQVSKHLKAPHEFVLFSDRDRIGWFQSAISVRNIRDIALCNRSCFCRLRMFDPDWQRENGFTGWIISLDLDVVITGPLDDVFLPSDDCKFKILQGVNATNPNPFNGSVMMLRAGSYPEVWQNFSEESAQRIQYHEFPDDQGWIWSQLPEADGWRAGAETGIYAFQKPGWPMGDLGFRLPLDARIVAFIGRRKPGMYTQLDWVRTHWLHA